MIPKRLLKRSLRLQEFWRRIERITPTKNEMNADENKLNPLPDDVSVSLSEDLFELVDNGKHTRLPWGKGVRGPNGCPVIGGANHVMVAMLAHSANIARQREEAEANEDLILLAVNTHFDLLRALKAQIRVDEASDAYYTHSANLDYEGDWDSELERLDLEFQSASSHFLKLRDAALSKVEEISNKNIT